MSFKSGIQKRSAGKYGFSTDVFANKGKVYIEFFHVPSGETVKFKGFITDFKDNYNLDFNREQVYGRMDPIVTYKNTSREIYELGYESIHWRKYSRQTRKHDKEQKDFGWR